MLTFITIVLAIVVAQVLLTVGAFALLANKRIMKAYMKWAMKLAEEVEDEVYDL